MAGMLQLLQPRPPRLLAVMLLPPLRLLRQRLGEQTVFMAA